MRRCQWCSGPLREECRTHARYCKAACRQAAYRADRARARAAARRFVAELIELHASVASQHHGPLFADELRALRQEIAP